MTHDHGSTADGDVRDSSSGWRSTSSWRRARSSSPPAPNRFGDEPNTNIDPVTLGLPGALPVLNRHAVELAMRIGLALNCRIQACSFHRKNYFYPDMPKAYQISQYDVPLNVDGWLDLPDGTRIGIERAHLEEDTGKSTHVGRQRRSHPRQRRLADRLQPRRRAAGRDRRPPRHPHRRAGPPVRQRAARHPRGRRRLRRQDGGGFDARRRQRQRAPPRRAVRHALRDQEPQLGALARPGDRVRGPPADRPHRVRRGRPPGDPPLGRGRRPHAHAADQGGRRRLPVLPRARSGAARPRRRVDRARPRRAADAPGGPPARGWPRRPALPPTARRSASSSSADRTTTCSPSAPPAATPPAPSCTSRRPSPSRVRRRPCRRPTWPR